MNFYQDAGRDRVPNLLNNNLVSYSESAVGSNHHVYEYGLPSNKSLLLSMHHLKIRE